MSRWNISDIFFVGEGGRVRSLELLPGQVNIITGASGTGKSTLIKAIDYCLGSSACELAAHVKRHCIAVGVKWVMGEAEMIIARVIPPLGQNTSTKMFVSSGRNLPIPNSLEKFQGATTVGAAKAYIERAFGIGGLGNAADGSDRKWRPTVRHSTAYMFVPKNIIYNEQALLHGLDQADEAQPIIETMPYFLGVVSGDTVGQERELRELRKRLEREEQKLRARNAAGSEYKKHAMRLLLDAHRCGLLAELPSDEVSEAVLENALRRVKSTQPNQAVNPSENELANLHAQRRSLLSDIDGVKRQSRATHTALQEMSGFEGAVRRQYEKLKIAEHLQPVAHACPLCEAPSVRGVMAAKAIRHSIEIVRSESVAVENVKPRFVEHEDSLNLELTSLNSKLRRVDERIKTWVRQSEESRRLDGVSQYYAHLTGKVSQFLEMTPVAPQPGADLDVLRAQIENLEAKFDREAKQVLLTRAERKVSQYLSAAFADLPTVAPCVGADLEFYSRPPDVAIIEKGSRAVLKMADSGSDENYLAIHIALAFALQQYLGQIEAPVPAFLVFDQISRPYYPSRGEDETLIESDDEDTAMRRHLDFFFKATEAQKDLQVLLIEHAYFADDPRYVAATRKRWHKTSGDALIPYDWPKRSDSQ